MHLPVCASDPGTCGNSDRIRVPFWLVVCGVEQNQEIFVNTNLLKITLILLVFPIFVSAAPNLVLKDFNGKAHNVSNYIGKGKWTVVVLWAHDCPVCNSEIYHMTFFHDAHQDKDATVLGVSVDGWSKRDKAETFVETHALNFPNLIAEPRQNVLGKFGGGKFYGTPTFYIYAPNGEFMAQQVGPLTQEALEGFINNAKQASSDKGRTQG